MIRLLGALLLASLPAAAGTLTGTVRNVTTGQPAPGETVVLMDMQAGMDVLASARTDAQGRYQLQHDVIGRGPVLVRVQYQGVNYHTNVPPGRDSADLEIHESTPDASVMDIATRMVVVQPNGPVLLVGEEFNLHNHSSPPRTWFRADGTFEFQLPEGARLSQVSAWGPAGLPLVQGTVSRGANREAIVFPIRPGENGVRISYELPYADNRAALRLTSPYNVTRVVLIAPPQLQVAGGGFAPSGMEQGWSLYARDAASAGSVVEIGISGTAPPPQPEPQGAVPTAAPGAQLQVIPGRLDTLKWILIAGFSAVFLLGLVYLWKRPVAVPAGGADFSSVHSASPGSAAPANDSQPAAAVVSTVAQVDQDVRVSLDELKESLFRLELRRQAGTISEEDYARERRRTEQVLRDLLKG